MAGKTKAVRCRKRAFKKQRGRCFWCNYPMYRSTQREWHSFPNQRQTAEHLITQKEGGPDTRENIVAACLGCNGRRGKMPLAMWFSYLLRNVMIHDRERHLAVILQKLSKYGITRATGQPEQSAPVTANTADSPPQRVIEPAPS